jgi:hypothetical protein
VNKAPRDNMFLRFKNIGVKWSNGKKSWQIPYEEAIKKNVTYYWAEDYEI